MTAARVSGAAAVWTGAPANPTDAIAVSMLAPIPSVSRRERPAP